MKVCGSLFALLFAAAAAHAQDKVSLKWKYSKGETIKYQLTQNSKTDAAGIEADNETHFEMTQEVTDVADNGDSTLKATYTRVKMKVTGPMASEYDSAKDKDPDHPMGMVLAAMVNQPFTVKVSAKGEVLEVSGMEKIMEQVQKKMEESGSPLGDEFKKMLSNDGMKRMMQQNYAMLPKDPVGPGDTWEHEFSMPMPMIGTLVSKSKLTLKELQEGGKKAVVAMDTKMESKPDEKGEEPMIPMKLGEAGGKSELVFDVEKGRLESMKGQMKMTMSMEMGDQKIDVATTTTQELRLVKEGAPEIPSEK